MKVGKFGVCGAVLNLNIYDARHVWLGGMH